MIRTGEQYRDSIRDGREVYINGECVKDVTTHPANPSWIFGRKFMTCSTMKKPKPS